MKGMQAQCYCFSHRAYIAQTLRVQPPHRQPHAAAPVPRNRPPTPRYFEYSQVGVTPSLCLGRKKFQIFQEELLCHASSVYGLLTQPPPSPNKLFVLPWETHMHAFACYNLYLVDFVPDLSFLFLLASSASL